MSGLIPCLSRSSETSALSHLSSRRNGSLQRSSSLMVSESARGCPSGTTAMSSSLCRTVVSRPMPSVRRVNPKSTLPSLTQASISQ